MKTKTQETQDRIQELKQRRKHLRSSAAYALKSGNLRDAAKDMNEALTMDAELAFLAVTLFEENVEAQFARPLDPPLVVVDETVPARNGHAYCVPA